MLDPLQLVPPSTIISHPVFLVPKINALFLFSGCINISLSIINQSLWQLSTSRRTISSISWAYSSCVFIRYVIKNDNYICFLKETPTKCYDKFSHSVFSKLLKRFYSITIIKNIIIIIIVDTQR